LLHDLGDSLRAAPDKVSTQLEPLIVGLFGAVRLVSVRVVTITARAKLVEQRRNLVAEHWGREEA
jgi:hypothetical protein